MDLTPAAVAATFDLGPPLGGWNPLANGDAPTDSRVLATTRGRWVVRTDRLLSDWHHEQALRVHRLQYAALAAGIPMPQPVEPRHPPSGTGTGTPTTPWSG